MWYVVLLQSDISLLGEYVTMMLICKYLCLVYDVRVATIYYTVYTIQYTLYSLHYTVYVQCTYTVWCISYTIHYIVYTINAIYLLSICVMHITRAVHCTVYSDTSTEW